MSTYAIGDVHGCYKTLMALIERLNIGVDDKVYFIGDLINKGPSSKAVVDQIIHWRNAGLNMTVIRGNHEQKLLSLDGSKSRKGIEEYEKLYSAKQSYQNFFVKNHGLKPLYKAFFKTTSLYEEHDDFLLVHAGFNSKKSLAFTDVKSMLSIRDWAPDYDATLFGGRTVIHGHQSVDVEHLRTCVVNNSPVLPIDTGCVYVNQYPSKGLLSAIRLEDKKLYHQHNLDISKA